jgi:hypothetical protein
MRSDIGQKNGTVSQLQGLFFELVSEDDFEQQGVVGAETHQNVPPGVKLRVGYGFELSTQNVIAQPADNRHHQTNSVKPQHFFRGLVSELFLVAILDSEYHAIHHQKVHTDKVSLERNYERVA